MKKTCCAFLFLGFLSACDLQPKIASIPDSVGDFISERYPTLLAEPDSEIYKTAVADYGVYASPTLYGNGDVTGEDYVLYSPTDDYMMPAQDTDVDARDVGMPVDDAVVPDNSDDINNDVASANAQEYGFTPDDDIDDLIIPDYKTENLVVKPWVAPQPESKAAVATTVAAPAKAQPAPKADVRPEPGTGAKQDAGDSGMVRAPVRQITVAPGDTLYSVSRKYSVPVNDLAVMNKISAPFTLSVGQKLKVPDISSGDVARVASQPHVASVADTKADKNTATKTQPVAQSKAVAQTKKSTTPTKPTTPAKATVATAAVQTSAGAAKSVAKSTAKTGGAKSTAGQAESKSGNKSVKKSGNKTETGTQQKKTATQSGAGKSDAKQKNKTTQQSGKSGNRSGQKMMARSASKFSWPVRGKILSGYGAKSNGLFNDGINVKAARGTTVAAAENGLVAYAGNEVKGMGNLVIIQHSDGWMTVYAHMDSMQVKRGTAVMVGQKIGTVGQSGKVDQPQLHFEIRKGTRAYNPVNYLKK